MLSSYGNILSSILNFLSSSVILSFFSNALASLRSINVLLIMIVHAKSFDDGDFHNIVSIQNGGSWSSEGCWVVTSNATVTVCQCDHLTHFAVLMNLSDEDRVRLSMFVLLEDLKVFI